MECEFSGTERFSNQRETFDLLRSLLQDELDRILERTSLQFSKEAVKYIPMDGVHSDNLSCVPVEYMLMKVFSGNSQDIEEQEPKMKELFDRLEWIRLVSQRQAISSMNLIR